MTMTAEQWALNLAKEAEAALSNPLDKTPHSKQARDFIAESTTMLMAARGFYVAAKGELSMRDCIALVVASATRYEGLKIHTGKEESLSVYADISSSTTVDGGISVSGAGLFHSKEKFE